jgi:hypothetical protein
MLLVQDLSETSETHVPEELWTGRGREAEYDKVL